MPARTALLPGAEPYQSSGGPVGALLCHGFTGCPQSLRPWAEHLAAAGLTVTLPRLPGHGTDLSELSSTRWEDWYAEVERAFDDLTQRCESVFVLGLSMGGALALRLAEMHPGRVRGLVLVNPSLHGEHPALQLLPLLRFVVPSLGGPRGDIRKPGVLEQGYDRMPLQALHSLTRLWQVTQRDLGRVTAPVLLYRSAVDHVVEPASGAKLVAGVSGPVEEHVLHDSYHVATLDNDAPAIFDGSLAFIRSSVAARPRPGGQPAGAQSGTES
jgi:carboxylesterase